MTYLVRLTLLRSSRSQFVINRTINLQNYFTLHYRKMFAHPGLDRYATGSQTQRLYLQNLEDPSRSDLTTRVLFEGTRGVGVAYLKDGIDQQVRIKKEVILSARAINSPQILLLSGVGPADILQTFDIPIVAAVPGIGHNLQNHLGLAKCWIS